MKGKPICGIGTWRIYTGSLLEAEEVASRLDRLESVGLRPQDGKMWVNDHLVRYESRAEEKPTRIASEMWSGR